MRGRPGRAPRPSSATTRPPAAASHDDDPWRSTATGTSGTTAMRSVCGNPRSNDAPATIGTLSARWASSARSSPSRLSPTAGASAFRTCAATSGGAPSTAICSTANAEVVRAAA